MVRSISEPTPATEKSRSCSEKRYSDKKKRWSCHRQAARIRPVPGSVRRMTSGGERSRPDSALLDAFEVSHPRSVMATPKHMQASMVHACAPVRPSWRPAPSRNRPSSPRLRLPLAPLCASSPRPRRAASPSRRPPPLRLAPHLHLMPVSSRPSLGRPCSSRTPPAPSSSATPRLPRRGALNEKYSSHSAHGAGDVRGRDGAQPARRAPPGVSASWSR